MIPTDARTQIDAAYEAADVRGWDDIETDERESA